MAFTTRKTLLVRIREDGDGISWRDFFETYRPLIWLMGGDFNLSPEEKENLVQEVMGDFFNAQRHFLYDRTKGRFRDYFRQIIRRRIQALFREKAKRRETEEAPPLELPDLSPTELELRWDEEWRMHLLKEAQKEVRAALPPRMIQIFEMWHIQDLGPKEIAKAFGLSLATVYNYRNTVLEALRSAVAALEERE